MRTLFILIGLLVASPAFAHERPLLQPAQPTSLGPLDCYCRAQGRMFAPGELVCLRTAEGGRMARCEMVINVMSWGLTERLCPES